MHLPPPVTNRAASRRAGVGAVRGVAAATRPPHATHATAADTSCHCPSLTLAADGFRGDRPQGLLTYPLVRVMPSVSLGFVSHS